MPLDSNNLWVKTTGYGGTSKANPLLSPAENARAERIRICRALFDGRHRQVFLDEGRTQFDFAYLEVQGRIIRPYVTFNLLKLATTTMTDLLLGEEPAIRIDDPEWQDTLDTLKDRTDLHRVLYDVVQSASWSAEGLAEIVRWDGEVYVQALRSDEVFPQGERQPDGQYASYRRYATSAIRDGDATRTLALESTYYAGRIERRCFWLNDAGGKTEETLAKWPTKRADGSDLLPIEETGIDWNTIVWMPNELSEGVPTSDYDGLLDLQDELNAKHTMMAIVLAKHAAPVPVASDSLADQNGQLKLANRILWRREGSTDRPLEYVTWDASLEAAREDRDFTLNALCIAAELSQGLLGLEKGGAPESARKLRLQATKALARAKRKAAYVKPFIRTVVDTSMMLERAGRVVRLAMGGIAGVDLRDGLPVDELDQATVISTLTGGKPTMSVERGVRMQMPDDAAADEEISLLKASAAEATPSVLFGEPAKDPQIPAADDTASADAGTTDVPEAAATGQELQTSQATVLNGAQVQAATNIVALCAAGEIPRDAAIGQLKILFNLSQQQAEEMLGTAGTGTTTTPNINPAEAAGGAA
jgi:hypothetical protein